MIRCVVVLDKGAWEPTLVVVHEGGVLHDWHTGGVLEVEPAPDIVGHGDLDGPAYRPVNGLWAAIVPKSEIERVTEGPIL
jgi:hypothetical protein